MSTVLPIQAFSGYLPLFTPAGCLVYNLHLSLLKQQLKISIFISEQLALMFCPSEIFKAQAPCSVLT